MEYDCLSLKATWLLAKEHENDAVAANFSGTTGNRSQKAKRVYPD
jgi:hypothetical protein